LETEVGNAFINMAIDEAILCSRIRGKVPNTLRLYQWNPSAVSFGRFQNIHSVVNLEECAKKKVNVVRRITGGGAVYHDSNDEVTYSVIVKGEDLETEDVVEAYRRICAGIIRTVRFLGLEAEFEKGSINRCPNITVGAGKISGSAQANRKGVILQHGTLLVNVDLKKMFAFLKFPWKKDNVDLVSVARKKITSIADELDSSVSLDQIRRMLLDGFEEALGVRFAEGALTEGELNLAHDLAEKKFATQEWNLEGKSKFLPIKPIC
jgi:lipoate-protein ligase A